MRALPETFSLPQRLLHWAMVLLLLFNLLFPQGVGGKGLDLGFSPPATVHFAIGVTIVVLAVIRLFLRLAYGVPPEPLEAPKFFRVLARLGQWTFYLLFFAVPLTGIMAYQGGATALFLHANVFRPLFAVLIVAHVGLGLAHQYYWRTNMLKKIVLG
mgnify:FL=1